MKLTPQEKAKVIKCCNENLIRDWEYDPNKEFYTQWFIRQFAFLNNEKIQEYLGNEFYHARFTYTLMQTLSLPMGKNKGIVKFQIIQYASICEALLNYTLDLYYKNEIESRFAATTFNEISQAVSTKTQITHEGEQLFLCSKKTEKAQIAWLSNPKKADFACEKGIIVEKTKDEYVKLYDLRNNAHIIKAAKADYYPKLEEASRAYELVFKFTSEIRSFFVANPITD